MAFDFAERLVDAAMTQRIPDVAEEIHGSAPVDS
jgi:hypothetical protein